MMLELEIWREACRHLDIHDSLSRMLPVLARHLPIDAITLRRLDVPRARLETVAQVGRTVDVTQAPFELPAPQMARVLALFERRTAHATRLDGDDPLFGATPSEDPSRVASDVIVAPLADDEGPAGVLALIAREGARVSADHAKLVSTIVEPLVVALANDRRVHELAQLREAALAENRALLTRLNRQSIVESIIGERGGLRTLMERVEQVANAEVPVLLLGETGSGKEVIARALHERSRRREGPMVRVNCGAIPSELIDSELFGHERGSFTGAVGTRKGWFERADGGTLLLDEVGELPAAAQVRLLRILQEGTLERVGGQRTLHVDVRIVAATHRDLHQMVQAGQFREDLWYRLSVFPLRLPPVRERLEDLPELASHFAARAGARLGAGPLTPTREDLHLLLAYSWPGNVRELAAVIERAAILGHGKKLEVAAALGLGGPLPTAPRTTASAPRAETNGHGTTLPAVEARSQKLDDIVVAHIERVLASTRGRIEGPKGAAALLGINPHTLRARMRKLRLDWSRFRGADAD
ncbi:sigma-54 interaction domain-containing protein [Sandaracinus amylolyticus]|uniref:sigma-54 interaction domain-containing protein n=1 Tax=Sandaracinus amylolyticus TaxID=927083 RepID=UPI001F016F2C|nr:sigma 54-interacting transcriptional regulator [Sandaracinus amylolyticus]UJR81745.1 Formate hydrogenlyase transcriptional activator [Sandaracinus amylolyticus]